MSSGGFWKPAPVVDSGLRDDDDNVGRLAVASASFHAPIAQQRMLLPIYKHKRQILFSAEHYPVTVICGETGSGKSTQIVQYLVETGGWARNDFVVVCTQPRRIAAVSLAQRVAQEMNTPLGDRVGYTVRFDEKVSTRTQIKFVTDGLLLREACQGDSLLSQYSVIMVDEAHERNVNSDALLGLLKRLRGKRKGLRVIISSATIDAERFLDFFTKYSDEKHEEGTIISVDGRQHPIDVLYLEKPARDYIDEMVDSAWRIHSGTEKGDILCFLPSGEEIDRAIRLAEERFHGDKEGPVELLPLYGSLPLHMQTRVFKSPSSKHTGKSPPRRIIWSTNIAETSVTVPNILFVIDSGLVKLPYFDPRTGLERLIVSPISQASARQRAGRAGRISAGKCFRLYTESFLLKNMEQQTPPEILRMNLASFILSLKALGVDNILTFELLDTPSIENLSHGLEILHALGAIDDHTRLTQTGLDMSRLPTDPMVAKMLLMSLNESCAWEILSVAAALQVRDLFQKPRRSSYHQQQVDYEQAMAQVADCSGDHVTYANLLAEEHLTAEECKERFINWVAFKRALEVRKQLASCLRSFGRLETALGLSEENRSHAMRKCVAAGFFAQVAKLSNDGRYYTLRRHIMVTPSTSSVYASLVTSSEYIVYGESLDGARGGIEVKHVSMIEAQWLREVAPHYFE